MGSLGLGDFFSPLALTYPASTAQQAGPQPPACGSAPYAPPERDGFFNRLFAPTDLTYPLPACNPAAPPSPTPPAPPLLLGIVPTPSASPVPPTPSPDPAPAPAPPTPTPAPPPPPVAEASTVTTAPAAPPVTIVVAPWIGQAGGALPPGFSIQAASPPADAPANPSVVAAPPATPPIAEEMQAPAPPPADVLSSAYSFNPKFRAHHPRANETYLEEVLDEKITAKMMEKDAPPLAFTVPDGCDSVQLLYGALELNPGVGKERDLDQVVIVGAANLCADVGEVEGPLTPGTALIVSVPWRAASWVDLPANRLRVNVLARFFDSQANT